MKIPGYLIFLSYSAFAQTPGLSGVWQADLRESKIAGPPLKSYLAIITQEKAVFNRRTKEQALQVTDLSGAVTPFGEERETLKFFISDKPAMSPFEGIPARLVGNASGDTVTVTGQIAGSTERFTRTYTLSSDHQKLTMRMTGVEHDGRPFDNLYVLLKQPDAAGDSLRQPQETAGDHFKNVKTDAMKSLPTSEFIDDMRYFAWALGKDCEFCHVEHHFDSDQKKEKKTARKMIEMTAAIDQNHFEGHPEVRCFTCHSGNPHPRAYPPFSDQTTQAPGENRDPLPPAAGKQ